MELCELQKGKKEENVLFVGNVQVGIVLFVFSQIQLIPNFGVAN